MKAQVALMCIFSNAFNLLCPLPAPDQGSGRGDKPGSHSEGGKLGIPKG